MITNEVSVAILQSYMSLPQHIRKAPLIRRIITPRLCTAIGSQQFRKESRKLQGELCLNVITPFTIIVVVLQLRDGPKTAIWVNQNGGTSSR